MVAGRMLDRLGLGIPRQGVLETLRYGSHEKVVARIANADGRPLYVQQRHARMSAIMKPADDAGFVLRLEHTRGTEFLSGPEAMRAAAQLLPSVNRFGGSKAAVADAVRYLETAGGPPEALSQMQRTNGAAKRVRRSVSGDGEIHVTHTPGALHALPLRERLALEMALHEEQERRAMTGELHDLERVWREAEEIAKISDTMFDKPALNEALTRLKELATPTRNRSG